jgi:hypothetical protein
MQFASVRGRSAWHAVAVGEPGIHRAHRPVSWCAQVLHMREHPTAVSLQLPQHRRGPKTHMPRVADSGGRRGCEGRREGCDELLRRAAAGALLRPLSANTPPRDLLAHANKRMM